MSNNRKRSNTDQPAPINPKSNKRSKPRVSFKTQTQRASSPTRRSSRIQQRQAHLLANLTTAPGGASSALPPSSALPQSSAPIQPAPIQPQPAPIQPQPAPVQSQPQPAPIQPQQIQPISDKNEMDVDGSPSLTPPPNTNNTNNPFSASEDVPPNPNATNETEGLSTMTHSAPQPVQDTDDFKQPFNQANMVRLLRESQSYPALSELNLDFNPIPQAVSNATFTLPTTANQPLQPAPTFTLPTTANQPLQPNWHNQIPAAEPTMTAILQQLTNVLAGQQQNQPITTTRIRQKADPLGRAAQEMVNNGALPGFARQRFAMSSNKAYTATKSYAPEQRQLVSRQTPSDLLLLVSTLMYIKMKRIKMFHKDMNANLKNLQIKLGNGSLTADDLNNFFRNINILSGLDCQAIQDNINIVSLTADCISFARSPGSVAYLFDNIHSIITSNPTKTLTDSMTDGGFNAAISHLNVTGKVHSSGINKPTRRPICRNLSRYPMCTNLSAAHRREYYHPKAPAKPNAQANAAPNQPPNAPAAN